MGIGCLVYQAESNWVTTNYLSGCMENNGHRSSSVHEAQRLNDKMTITWDLNCDTLYLVVSGLYHLMQAYSSNVCAN